MGYHVSSLEELGDGYGFQDPPGAGRDRFRRQRARVPSAVRGPRALPRHTGRALLRPPRHGDVHDRRQRARGGGGRSRPRRVDDAAPRREPHRRGRRVVHRRRQGRLRRARRPADGPGRAGEAAGPVTQGGADVNGLMMDFQLTLPMLLRRAETYSGQKEIVTRLPDRSFHRTNYAETCRRARALAVALQSLGLERGDRVATLCWNHHQHHEAYLGIPCGGFVLHTLNLRLHPNDLAYIAKHAGDRAVIVDKSLVPLLGRFVEQTEIEHVFVVEDSYEELLTSADPDTWSDPELGENEAAAMCYTSGTT